VTSREFDPNRDGFKEVGIIHPGVYIGGVSRENFGYIKEAFF
jgi:hypothetical protein